MSRGNFGSMTEIILILENYPHTYLPKYQIISFEGFLTYYFKYVKQGLKVFIFRKFNSNKKAENKILFIIKTYFKEIYRYCKIQKIVKNTVGRVTYYR